MSPTLTLVLCYLPFTPLWPIVAGLFVWGTKKSEATKAELTLAKHGLQAALIGLLWLCCLPLIPVWIVVSLVVFAVILIVLVVVGAALSWLGVGVLIWVIAVILFVVFAILFVVGTLLLIFLLFIGCPLLLIFAMVFGLMKVNDESFRGIPPFSLAVKVSFRNKEYAGKHGEVDLDVDAGAAHKPSDVEEGEVEDGEVVDSSSHVPDAEGGESGKSSSKGEEEVSKEEGELSSSEQ